jgi:hypothetical protein
VSGKALSQGIKNSAIFQKDDDFLQFQPLQTQMLFDDISLFLVFNSGLLLE